MKVKRLTAALLAAAIAVSSIAPEAFAEISGAGVGGTSTVNEPTVDTSTDPASGGSDKAEEPGEAVPGDTELPSEPGEPVPGDTELPPEPGEDESVYTYSVLDDGTIEITGYNGSAENVVIPAQIDGKSVTRIGDNAFEKSSAKEIVIPENVIGIGDVAFADCTKLTSIAIPDSVTEIGNQTFEGCTSLASITIPSSITNIRYRTFAYCYSLTSVSIPNSVTTIGVGAFFDCKSLASIIIPDSATDIEYQAFCNCASLKEVTVPASVTTIGDEAFGYYEGYYDDTGSWTSNKVEGFKINYVKNTYGHYYAVKNGFTDEICIITNELDDGTLEITKYAGNSATYVIPDEIDGKKVTRIGGNLFYGCTELTSVTMPDGVTSIGSCAFYGTSLETVTIPDSVTSIYCQAFYNCTSLKEVTIPESVTYIADEAFGYYYDGDGSDTKKVDGFKINYVKNTYGHMYALKNGFTDEAYIITNELDDGTLEITKYAGNSATYVIPDEIDGKSVTKIKDYAFSYCTELTSVFIPKSVNCIESSSFSDDSLNYIEVDSDNKTYSSADGVLYSKDKATLVRYPQGKKETTFEVPATVSVIDFGAFDSNRYIKDVILPENLTSIDNGSFCKCASIVSIAIPENVSSIGNYAFAECDSLKYADIPANVSIIGVSPFRNCQSLENIKVDEANKWFTAENGILYNKDKTNLINYPAGKKDSSYVIPEGIRTIGDMAFYGCINLCELTIPDSVTEIKELHSKALHSISVTLSVIVSSQRFMHP